MPKKRETKASKSEAVVMPVRVTGAKEAAREFDRLAAAIDRANAALKKIRVRVG